MNFMDGPRIITAAEVKVRYTASLWRQHAATEQLQLSAEQFQLELAPCDRLATAWLYRPANSGQTSRYLYCFLPKNTYGLC